MTKLEIVTLVITFVVTGLIVACEHKEGPQPEEEKPATGPVEFTNISPESAKIYEFGEAVYIQANLTSQNTMHGYDVYLRNLKNGDTVFKYSQHVHGLTLLIAEEWVNEVEEDAEMEIDFLVRTDHEGEHVVKTVGFKCKAE